MTKYNITLLKTFILLLRSDLKKSTVNLVSFIILGREKNLRYEKNCKYVLKCVIRKGKKIRVLRVYLDMSRSLRSVCRYVRLELKKENRRNLHRTIR